MSSQTFKTMGGMTNLNAKNKSLSRNKETTMFNAITHIGAQNTNTWSKRENNWFEIEEKLIFKNNVANHSEGEPKAIEDWLHLINKL